MRWKTTAAALAAMLCLLAAACGGEGADASAEPEPPVGQPVLPDLMPRPQRNVLSNRVKDRWRVFFNTTIVNVGAGDFILRATREVRGSWTSEQDIPYSEGGAKRIRVRAPLVWGGDGHDHWHIVRVASVWLVPLDPQGRPVSDAKERVDSKIGFCFYDHSPELEGAPDAARYSAESCGEQEDTVVGMGLTPGWSDVYLQTLPGQSIDVTGLPDGTYRLFTEVDEQGWFREASRENNRTWLDIELEMTPQGLAATTVGTGPVPAWSAAP